MRKMNDLTLIAITLSVFVCLSMAFCGGVLIYRVHHPLPQKQVTPTIVQHATEAEQARNKELVGKLITERLISTADDRYCDVLPAWQDLTYQDKQTMGAIVWCHANRMRSPADARGTDLAHRRLVLRDALTRKQIGTYSPSAGLRLE
jgi:hypothetical protein